MDEHHPQFQLIDEKTTTVYRLQHIRVQASSDRVGSKTIFSKYLEVLRHSNRESQQIHRMAEMKNLFSALDYNRKR